MPAGVVSAAGVAIDASSIAVIHDNYCQFPCWRRFFATVKGSPCYSVMKSWDYHRDEQVLASVDVWTR